MIQHIEILRSLAAPITDPQPTAPPGSDKITGVIGNIKWAAFASLFVGFFLGVACWAGGRIADHHRAGRIGMILILCSLGGGLLYGIGYQLITHFSGTGP